MVKNLPATQEMWVRSIPGLVRSPGGGHGNPCQYSCLENTIDRRAWWAAIHRVERGWRWLKWLSRHACITWVISENLPNYRGASLVAQMVEGLPTMRETRVWSLGWEDLLEKEMATHSSILAWRIPRTEELGGLQSMGLQSWTWLSELHNGTGNSTQCSVVT